MEGIFIPYIAIVSYRRGIIDKVRRGAGTREICTVWMPA